MFGPKQTAGKIGLEFSWFGIYVTILGDLRDWVIKREESFLFIFSYQQFVASAVCDFLLCVTIVMLLA